jgi:hypothetical protein
VRVRQRERESEREGERQIKCERDLGDRDAAGDLGVLEHVTEVQLTKIGFICTGERTRPATIINRDARD